MEFLIAHALALTLQADVVYPWPIMDPLPPVATVDPIEVAQGDDPAPACIPVNEGCDDPEAPMSGAVASVEE